MKRWLAAMVWAGALLAGGAAVAQEVTMVGELKRIELAADQRSAVATLKNAANGEEVKLTVTDDLTLDKFKDKRIVEGDEIRARYQTNDGRNGAKSFKKTAGC
ncbi:MAG: hypothetical protein NDJ19_13015 [Ramlibacter sp.]|nr:hypothetical protein [Ramlibacter sp.]